MRSKNRKVKAIWLAGMLVAGLAAGSLPAEPVSAANGWDIPLNNYGESLSQSSVSITISGSGNEVLNADRGIAQGMIKRTASVAFGATDGYRVTVSGNPNLTGTNTKKTIPSAALTLSNMVNQWGWYAVNGSADCSASNVYKTMSTAGTQIDSGTLGASATKTYTMCFGMRVDTKQAADSYGGSVTVSAVAEPGTIRTGAFNGITYMQDMTSNICANAEENETAQLIDRRDNKKYWVTKLLDGNCWMSQNLDLDLSKSVPLTSMDSDVSSDWTPGQNTTKSLTTGSTSNTGMYSWDLGDYVIIKPIRTGFSCKDNNTGLGDCSEYFVAVGDKRVSSNPNFYKSNSRSTYNSTEYDAHYLAGNYYQWNAATAGTGRSISDTNASGSICPKGWKLPSAATSASTVNKGTYIYLLQRYGIASAYNAGGVSGMSPINGNSYNIAESPLFFVRSGHVSFDMTNKFGSAGGDGALWTSLAASDSNEAYMFRLVNAEFTAYAVGRSLGYSVRCLVQTP